MKQKEKLPMLSSAGIRWEQWGSFCPELPRGVISNIRYGQGYGAYQVVMEKCGTANGLQDIFTFQREGRGWQLTAYEN